MRSRHNRQSSAFGQPSLGGLVGVLRHYILSQARRLVGVWREGLLGLGELRAARIRAQSSPPLRGGSRILRRRRPPFVPNPRSPSSTLQPTEAEKKK